MFSCSDDGTVALTDYNYGKASSKGIFEPELDNLARTSFIDTLGSTSINSFALNVELGVLIAACDDATLRARNLEF